MKISTIGLDLAKNGFQVHGVDVDGKVIVRRRLRRGEVLAYFQSIEPCLVGMEACATAHHWARELTAMGHEVRLLPPTVVKPFVKRGKKNDAADAAAIHEAVQRPGTFLVPVKTEEQQAVRALHTQREGLIGERTRGVNGVRALFAEFGIIAPQGIANIAKLRGELENLPGHARVAA